ncbi:MAG: GNAT family N-acetyltransferase [Flavipsychrobacter sp.]
MNITKIDTETGMHEKFSNEKIASFLFEHLDQYGDKIEDITKCIEYTQKKHEQKGGFVLVASDGQDNIKGAVVVNETNMGGYIPENILVYIAVHSDTRGTGLGKRLMQAAIDNCVGDVALHVEKDNPAKFLYEKIGFTNPYLEMRYKK